MKIVFLLTQDLNSPSGLGRYAPLAQELARGLRSGQAVVSFAAGIPLDQLAALVPAGVAVARVMPNAPSLVGKGMNPVAFGPAVLPEFRSPTGSMPNGGPGDRGVFLGSQPTA